MAKRKVTPPARVILSWDEANGALAELACARQEIARIQTNAQREIDAMVYASTVAADPYVSAEAEILAGLEAFTRSHETELEGRSKRLPLGVVGLRKASYLKVVRTVKYVLDAIKARGAALAHCIRLKEELDKEAIAKLDADTLKSIGCKAAAEDNFYVDLGEVTVSL
jgi:phage host-nuclease inhibitor protein Gam